MLKIPIKVLILKEQVDQVFEEFAKNITDFYHYYRLETYQDKLVFKQQADFNYLIKESNALKNLTTTVWRKNNIITNITRTKLNVYPIELYNFFGTVAKIRVLVKNKI